VKLGLALFNLRPHQLGDLAARADALGFESVWVPEHLVLPTRFTSSYPYATDGAPPIRPESPLLDPLLVLTHVAARTTRIRLGTNVYLPALRHPIEVARAATTLDVLSGGRLTLGIGAGWLAEEFAAVAVDFASRGARLRECVRALRTLWTDAEPEFHGRFFDFGPVKLEPKPVQKPHPPLLFGGESETALKRAAALGDGWYGVSHTAATVAPKVERLRTLLADAGRSSAPFEITVSYGGVPNPDEVERCREAGVDRIVLLPWRRGSEAIDAIERAADRLL
jgi:probable F420-dependent oxidoreductase